MKYKLFVYLLTALPALMTASVQAQQDRYVSLGIHALSDSDTNANATTLGYEMRLNETIGLSIRGVTFDYDWESSQEFEEGDGTGIEAGVIFYPGTGNNFFTGVGLGIGQTEWEYWETDVFGFRLYTEEDDVTDYELWARIGYHFDLGGFHITPQAQVGNWFNTGNEFGAYFIGGVELGAKF